MVRKKQPPRTPVIAKPLNDVPKRNIVNNFVTKNIDDKEDTNDVIDAVTNNMTDQDTKNETLNDINNSTYNDTNSVTDNTIDSNVKEVTKNVTKKATRPVPKNLTIIKSITLGKKEIVAKFTSNKRSRPNYNLSEDTIEKIEKISDILGYKKAEFLDIYLNGTLTKILKSLEKNMDNN